MTEPAFEATRASGRGVSTPGGMGGPGNGSMSRQTSYVDDHPEAGNGPDDMPEVLREMTMIRGVLMSTEKAVEELLSRLDGVRHNRPEIGEINKQSAPEVVTPLGQDLRRIYTDLTNLNDRVLRVVGQLHL